MAIIDNLTLEVNADITKAKNALDNLSTSLTNLKTKMGTVGTSYKNLAKTLAGVTVSKDTTKAITNLASSLSTFNNVKANNLMALEKTGNIVTTLSSQLSSIASVPADKLDGIVKMATALSHLNNVKAGNIENTAKQLPLLLSSIKKISLSNQNAQQLERIARAGDSLARLNQVKPATIEKTANNLNALQGAMANISIQSIEKIERLATALISMSVANQNGLGNFGSIVKSANQIQQATPIQTTEQEVEGGDTEIEQKLPDTSQATAWAKVMGNVKRAVEKATSAFRISRRGLSLLSGAFKKATSHIARFLKAIGRIAFYRAIRGVLKEITQGLKEGVDNLAKYSKAIGEIDALKANQVMSGYASYFLYLKNALGTAIMPLLKALLPLVEAVINKFVALLDIIAQLGSAFFGLTYTSAQFFWVDYAESLDNANRSAGKLHKQLAGFDELNNLTTNSGGGGTDWGDISDYFGELEIMQKILEIVDKIKEAWQKTKKAIEDIFAPLKKVNERLKELWDKIVEKVSPHLDRIKDALSTIWEEGLKPLLEGLVEGFFEGFYGEEFESLPDLIGFLADKLADCAEKIADFVSNIDNEKIKEFGHSIGFLVGFLNILVNPLRWVLLAMNPAIEKLEELKKRLDANNDGVVDFDDAITALMTPITDWILENINLAGAILWLDEKIKKISEKVSKFAEKVQNAVEKVRDFFQTINQSGKFDKLISGLDKIWQVAEKVKKTFEGLLNINLFEWARKIAEMFSEGIFDNSRSSGIATRANGGFVTRGDLFVANERGAEMVGSVNGNTAVANNQMITEAIAQATYRSMSQALSENGMNITIEGDSDGMFKILQKKNREYKNMTGRSAFA